MTAPPELRRRGHRRLCPLSRRRLPPGDGRQRSLRRRSLRRGRRPASFLLGVGLLWVFGAACSSSGSDSGSTASTTPTSATSSAASASGGSGTASASSTAEIDLPTSCPQVIPTVEVDKALGIQLPGVPVFVAGAPEPDIQRLGRSTCLFGVQPDGVSSAVQASVFAYATPQVASSRIEATVSDARDQGQLTENVTAGDTPAVLLNGASDLTAVAAKDDRTYSATLSYGVIAGTEQKPAVITLLAAMIAQAAVN